MEWSMTPMKEIVMNRSEDGRITEPEDVIELGVASVETKGRGEPLNEGLGQTVGVGISE
ncbi:benenodin family lasso peptide [Paenibacillus dendritiformis]|uniref:benenodin family lasso peptide n=1 Tax=Paenibacillus dendritiformis TaxID=130049 RepID=UPI0018CDA5FF|nr:benenodin family lasso peptide [Paenibacillus dendritiformis]